MKKSVKNRVVCVAVLVLAMLLLLAKPISRHGVSACQAAENIKITQKEISPTDAPEGTVLAEYVYYDDNGEAVLVETYRNVSSSTVETGE